MLLFDPKIRMLRLMLLGSSHSLRDVADAVGCAVSKLSDVANGNVIANDALRARLSEFFGMPEDELFAPIVTALPFVTGTSNG